MKRALFLFAMSWLMPGHILLAEPVSFNSVPLAHHVSNLETEVAYLKQKCDNQDRTIDALRDELATVTKAINALKNAAKHDEKLAKIEQNIQKLVADIQKFKTHANEANSAISSTQNSLSHQKEQYKIYDEQIKNLQSALKSLAAAMQMKKPQTASGEKYCVKRGDTLEKIAKNHKISVKELKEANTLQSDTLRVGQQLQIPG